MAALHALALRKPRRADMTRPTAAGDEIGAGVGVSSWGAGRLADAPHVGRPTAGPRERSC